MRQRQVCASNMVGVEERRCREIRLAVVVVAVVQALGSAARADPPPTPACEKRCIDPKIRTLKGHTFIPPARFDTAFVTTHFGILLGGAYQKITPSAPANAPVLEVETSAQTPRKQRAARPVERWCALALRRDSARGQWL